MTLISLAELVELAEGTYDFELGTPYITRIESFTGVPYMSGVSFSQEETPIKVRIPLNTLL